MTMHIVVCIVAFRNADDVIGCLAALGRSTYNDYEIVICENGGREAYRLLTDRLSMIADGQRVETILADSNLGFAGGVNVCISARPDADAWWVLNPDTEPEAEALGVLVARLSEGDANAVAGILQLPGGRVQAYGGHWRPWLARPVSIGRDEPIGAPTRAEIEPRLSYLLGASMLIGRRFIEVAGLMREDYFLYGEEIEWCLRAVSRGLKLGYAPGARVLHVQGTTTGSADSINARPRLPIYLDERNKLNIVRDVTPRRLAIAAPAAFALLTLRFARRRAWPQWRWAMSGWWAGVRNKRGQPPWMQ